MAQYKMHLLVCAGTGCRASQSDEIIVNLNAELKKQGLQYDAQVVATGCFGFCEKGPIVKILPDNTFYTQVKPEDCAEIISEHILKGRRVKRLLYEDPETRK
ncbi:MAG: (2Fe-2S) ferredoxin domain-containing protein, partial [Bacteroidales bacterium]|nr:(2Fe-2S) ferredoxin domain-containing protein [Bacteroidales bacterium]